MILSHHNLSLTRSLPPFSSHSLPFSSLSTCSLTHSFSHLALTPITQLTYQTLPLSYLSLSPSPSNIQTFYSFNLSHLLPPNSQPTYSTLYLSPSLSPHTLSYSPNLTPTFSPESLALLYLSFIPLFQPVQFTSKYISKGHLFSLFSHSFSPSLLDLSLCPHSLSP